MNSGVNLIDFRTFLDKKIETVEKMLQIFVVQIAKAR